MASACSNSRTDFGQDPRGPFASCSVCHYGNAFTDRATHLVLITGRDHQQIQVLRKTPSLFNVGQMTRFGADARNSNLQDQIRGAILSPVEMNGKHVTDEQLAALAAFLRTIKNPPSPIDRFGMGDHSALSERAKQGLAIFVGKGKCSICHLPPIGTNPEVRRNQFGATFSGTTDLGAFTVGTGQPLEFKVRPLRGLRMTAPYMHSGSLGNLGQVVRFYNQSLDLRLSDQEMSALVAFLESL